MRKESGEKKVLAVGHRQQSMLNKLSTQRLPR